MDEIFNDLTSLSDQITDPDLLFRFQEAMNEHNVIMAGDYNAHCPQEASMDFSLISYDLWLENHHHMEGITYDGP